MPTGYTAALCDGDQDFTEFVLHAAKGMGLYVHQRDTSIDTLPAAREVSDYYYSSCDHARSRFEEVNNMSMETASVKADEDYTSRLNSYLEDMVKIAARKVRLEAMKSKVELWNPGPEFDSFKSFMLEQIDSTISFDCNTSYRTRPVKKSPEAWLEDERNEAVRNLEYYIQSLAEEETRVADQNKLHNKLMGALGIPLA